MDTAATQQGPGQQPGQEQSSADTLGHEHEHEHEHGHDHDHERELTITIPLDRAAELIGAPLAAAGRVLSSRGGLPVYVGLGVMAAADVVAWPVAAAAGLGYAVLRRWGPLRPPPTPPAGGSPARPGPGVVP